MSGFKQAMLAYAKAVLDIEADAVEVTYEASYFYSEYTQGDARFEVEFRFEGQSLRVFDGEDAAELFQSMLNWEDERGVPT